MSASRLHVALRGGALDFEEVQTVETPMAWLWAVQMCKFSKAGQAETHSIHSAHAARLQDRRLLPHSTSPWLSPRDRTENLDQRDFARECYTSCVM